MARIFYIKCYILSILICVCLLFNINASFGQTNLNVSACNAYTLPWNTVATTVSGIYTHNYPKTPNPDSVVTINLTINTSPISSTLTSNLPSIVTNIIDEQFDVLNPGVTYTPSGWFQINKSAPVGTTAWFSGPFLSNGSPTFAPETGAGCLVADYLNTTGSGTINNWILSPTVTIQNGDVLSFYTIQNPQTPYADRLEVRMNSNGASTNVGTSSTTVGDFTTSLLTINNSLTPYAYPQSWTLYSIVISGLSAPTSARIAFRYFVTSGGALGANSDMIGLDNVKLTRTTTPKICAGNNLQLNVNTIGGVSPYSVVISNGGINSTHTSYTNGTNISKSPITNTTYSIVSVADANGCTVATKIGTPSVIVNQPITTIFNATQCANYTLPWGTTIFNSGLYSNVYVRANGCDSIINYNVIIKNPSTTNLVVSACNQYILPWNTTPVLASGTYSNLYQNVAMCDSNVSIVLTIKQPVTTATIINSCINFSLPWGGIVTSNGLYTHTYIGSNLCDSISNITVTILSGSNTTTSIAACNSYLLPWSTIPITISGFYTHIYTNVFGCDSIINYQIIINSPQTVIINKTACASYVLPWQTVATTTSGTYNHTFTGVNNCDSISTIILIINNVNSNVILDTAFISYLLPWGSTALSSGTYTHLYQNQNGCDSTVSFLIYIRPPLQLNMKVLLSGPFSISTSLMSDSLRILGLVPLSDPYRTFTYSASFVHVNNSAVQTIGSGVLAISGNNAIVDWVFVQLRSKFDSSIVLGTKSALVQRDGDVVSAIDGVSPIEFNNLLNDNYFVSVCHRNHLGIMSKNRLSLSNVPMLIDFTNPAFLLFQHTSKSGNASPLTGATRLQNGLRTLYAGNLEVSLVIAANKFITYNNWTLSDRAALLAVTGGVSTINGYSIFDADLNGYARFNGLNPDRIVILQNCLNSSTIIINQQLP